MGAVLFACLTGHGKPVGMTFVTTRPFSYSDRVSMYWVI